MASKNTLAHRMYEGLDFEDLSPGEKAAVTRAYNNQGGAAAPTPRAGFVTASVLRIGVNGSKMCGLEKGSTVQDLLNQANYEIDSDKEGVVAQSTGNSVELSDPIKNGEIYAISPEIKSA